MTVHLQEPALSYFSVPKCACTSLKEYFFEARYGLPFAEAVERGDPITEGRKSIHGFYRSLPFAETAPNSGPDWTRVAVVRDPVSRIVSCYSNKIRQKRVLANPRVRKQAKAAGLNLTPTIHDFVSDLDGYQRISPEIKHHSLPLSHFLGTDPAYFTRIYRLSEVPELTALVAERLGRPTPAVTHVQRSRSKDVADRLSDYTRARIRDRFAEDIALFGNWFSAPPVAASGGTNSA